MTSISAPTSLFSHGPRPDNGPAPYRRNAYDLLDLAHRPYATEVRRELDDWFSRLPPRAAAQISKRFRSPVEVVHRGAFFELYLHELGLRLGAEVDIDVGNDDADYRRPDLLFSIENQETFVEATALAGDDVHDAATQRHLDTIHDAVNAVDASAFFVEIDIEQHGSSTPSGRKITSRLQRMLDGLDPDVLLARPDHEDNPPRITVTVGDWRVGLAAYPLGPKHRDYEHHRVVGSRVYGMGEIDDLTPLRRKIRNKANHYGQLGKPFVLALLPLGTFVEDRDINHALLGPMGYHYDTKLRQLVGERQRDGAWMGPKGPINTRLSAVLTLVNLSPTSICAVQPTLWTNPWAAHPVTDLGPWRRIECHESGRTIEHPAIGTAAATLGLPERWPQVPRSG
jgi:hypothetical protein